MLVQCYCSFDQDFGTLIKRIFKQVWQQYNLHFLDNITPTSEQIERMKQDHPSLQQRMPCLNPVYPDNYLKLSLEVYSRILKEDYSVETNGLIQQLLKYGQTNYTCWVAKKRVYSAGNSTIKHQDQFSQEMIEQNLKNFQLWDFRNFIFDISNNFERQYDLMDLVLKQSPKNYHVWSNRTRLVGIVKNFSQQIKRTEIFIQSDVYNNSAWNYRAFCFNHLLVKDFQQQLKYVERKILQAVQNQASWNYLRGFFPCYRLTKFPQYGPKQVKLLSYHEFPQVKDICKKILEDQNIRQEKKVQSLLTILIIDSHSQQTVQYAKQICSLLADLQPMRANYYGWLRENL